MEKHVRVRALILLVAVVVSASVAFAPLVARATGHRLPAWFTTHRLGLGLDLKGGVHLVLGVDLSSAHNAAEREAVMARTLETLERRLNEFGVAEPTIARQGQGGDQILVQMPGVSDVEGSTRLLRATGVLHLQLVDRGPSRSRATLAADRPADSTQEVVEEERVSDVHHAQDDDATATRFYLLRKEPMISGDAIRTARASRDEQNRPSVSFTLTEEAGQRFAAMTEANIGRTLAIVVDGKVRSTARIDNRIRTDGQILGHFTSQDTNALAILLRSGALTVPVVVLAEQVIGSSLGADAIHAGVTASVVALVVVAIFLLGYYKGAGLNACVALTCNLVFLLGLLASMDVVLTLPGIAGLVLTIGIGVDSNVLVYERLKEELQTGRGVASSIDAAFRRVFWTLLDTHLAGLISAAFLFQFGTGSIRGFVVTLALGLAANLFTSTFVSKTLFDLRRSGTALSI